METLNTNSFYNVKVWIIKINDVKMRKFFSTFWFKYTGFVSWISEVNKFLNLRNINTYFHKVIFSCIGFMAGLTRHVCGSAKSLKKNETAKNW